MIQKYYNIFMETNIGEFVVKTLISVGITSLLNLWPIIILFILCSLTVILFQQYRYRKSGIYEVDRMSGEDFEQFLMGLFQRLGYKTEHIGKLGDYGGDLIIEKDGINNIDVCRLFYIK